MGFKLFSDLSADYPRLTCDVCGGVLGNIWNDLATATPVQDQTVDVTIHHVGCAASGSVSMKVVDFLGLFAARARIGDLGSDGTTETVYVRHPANKEFEA